MRTRLLHLWEVLNAGYWFVPTVMIALAVALAIALLTLDRRLDYTVARLDLLYIGGIEGARTLLATVAASIITVAGVVFSITIATLSQASNQFGPRLLRSFMRDTGNQVTLGTFSATFIFCMLVLRSLSAGEDAHFVPHVSVTAALLLSLACIAVLIYFIHHVSLSLQPGVIVASVADDLEQAIRTQFTGNGHDRDREGAPRCDPRDPPRPDMPPIEQAHAIPAPRDGYVQAIDHDALLDLAARRDALLRLECRAGDYVIRGSPLLRGWPADRCSDPATAGELSDRFFIGRQRTAEQDVEFALTQMAEIAVRALSAAVNDPYTAQTCIDRIGSALAMLAAEPPLSACRTDARGTVRLVVPVPTFARLVDVALADVRHFCRGVPSVVMRLLQTLALLAPQLRTPEQRDAIRCQADLVLDDARAALTGPDLRTIERLHGQLRAALGGDRSAADPAAVRDAGPTSSS